jgi:hypothetical protein
MSDSNFIKDLLDKTGIKYNVGYGYNINTSTWKGELKPYVKIRFFGEQGSKLDFGLAAQLEGFIGPCVGIGFGKKKWAKFDVGIGTEMGKLIDLKHIKPSIFAGLSISLN